MKKEPSRPETDWKKIFGDRAVNVRPTLLLSKSTRQWFKRLAEIRKRPPGSRTFKSPEEASGEVQSAVDPEVRANQSQERLDPATQALLYTIVF